ncbi:hypothetical protein [Nonomuraea sp. LPB2021202275-12-8]|uniref:hypothetical protein n=1 Tax=Nonomuraea sp. LPB2021202275-12-8 TaxID=3120159 RepID=UPI00300D3A63
MKRGMRVVGVLVLLTAGCGARVGTLLDDAPTPPPSGPWPMTAGVKIGMCTKDAVASRCAGRPLATKADGVAVLARLRTFRGISMGRIASGAGGREEGAYVTATLADRDDFPRLKASVERMPGVGGVTGWPTDFWTGKTEIGISLCPAKGVVDTEPCAGRGPATEGEKHAIYRRLRELPEVAAIYFADLAFVVREARHNARGGMSGGWELVVSNPMEEFHVKLAGGGEAAAEKVRKIAEALPGVWMAPWGEE